MEQCKVSSLYDLNETMAKELLASVTYPWEALKFISDFIRKIGPALDSGVYEKRGEDIWVAKSAKVAPTGCGNPPLRLYPGQRYCREGFRGGQFHGVKKCDNF